MAIKWIDRLKNLGRIVAEVTGGTDVTGGRDATGGPDVTGDGDFREMVRSKTDQYLPGRDPGVVRRVPTYQRKPGNK